MKLFTYVLTSCLLGLITWMAILWSFSVVWDTFAQGTDAADKVKCTPWTWKCYWETTKPMNILDDLIENDDTPIVETKLDTVDRRDTQQFTDNRMKFSWTLDSVRSNISIYLQWMVFIGLSMAVILIIYNWLMLMLSPLSPDQAAKVKTRMIAITVWIIVVTWFEAFYDWYSYCYYSNDMIFSSCNICFWLSSRFLMTIDKWVMMVRWKSICCMMSIGWKLTYW